jgi:hypothetical protein
MTRFGEAANEAVGRAADATAAAKIAQIARMPSR